MPLCQALFKVHGPRVQGTYLAQWKCVMPGLLGSAAEAPFSWQRGAGFQVSGRCFCFSLSSIQPHYKCLEICFEPSLKQHPPWEFPGCSTGPSLIIFQPMWYFVVHPALKMYLFLCTYQSSDSFICLEGRVEPFQQTFYFPPIPSRILRAESRVG